MGFAPWSRLRLRDVVSFIEIGCLLFFVSFVLFVVSLSFKKKLHFHHEGHEEHEGKT
jgi:hypothetical protein